MTAKKYLFCINCPVQLLKVILMNQNILLLLALTIQAKCLKGNYYIGKLKLREELFSASFYRQFSEDIKIKNYKI